MCSGVAHTPKAPGTPQGHRQGDAPGVVHHLCAEFMLNDAHVPPIKESVDDGYGDVLVVVEVGGDVSHALVQRR
eukprot:676273-Prymnesium_polylepis.1